MSDVRVMYGDAVRMQRRLEAGSVHMAVTSPPYYALRDYKVPGQIGLEPSPSEYLDTLLKVFDETYRVLRDDGVLFVNIGDSYSGSNGNGWKQSIEGTVSRGTGEAESRSIRSMMRRVDIVPAKNLLLIPERFAIAMQDRGWIVRSRIAWCKTSAMPESVRDRPSGAWEHIWIFTKSQRYYWDDVAVRQSGIGTHSRGKKRSPIFERNDNGRIMLGSDDGANLRNYWLLGPEPQRFAHYAIYPSEIPRRAIKAATSEYGACFFCGAPWVRIVERTAMVIRRSERADLLGEYGRTASSGTMLSPNTASTVGWEPTCRCDTDTVVPCTVLDMFGGSGTTGLVARELKRESILIELSPDSIEIINERLNGKERSVTQVVSRKRGSGSNGVSQAPAS